MITTILRIIAWVLALVAYIPIVVTLLILVTFVDGDCPGLPRVAKAIYRLISGQVFRDTRKAMSDFRRSIILTNESPPAPFNPNYQSTLNPPDQPSKIPSKRPGNAESAGGPSSTN